MRFLPSWIRFDSAGEGCRAWIVQFRPRAGSVTARGATRVPAGSAVLVMRVLGHLVRTIAGRLVRRHRGGDDATVDDATVDGDVAPQGNNTDDAADADAGSGSERASGSSSDADASDLRAPASMSMMLYNPLSSGSAPDVRRGVAVLARHPTTGEPVLHVHDRSRDNQKPSPLPLYEFRRVAPPTPIRDNDIVAELRRRGAAPVPEDRRTRRASSAAVGDILRARERGLRRGGGNVVASERVRLASRFLPNRNPTVVDELPSRAYCAQFVPDGSLFVCGFQERIIRAYEPDRDWRLRGEIRCVNLRWTVTDVSVAVDGARLAYASITPVVHVARVGVEDFADAAVDDAPHEELNLGNGSESTRAGDGAFGVWSARFDADASRLIAGASDGHVYVHDANRNVTTLRARAHVDDVNAVAWADLGGDANVVYTGSDDATIKVWDARTAGVGENGGDCGGGGGSSPRASPRVGRGSERGTSSSGRLARPCGVLVGHGAGVTHLDSRGDGRYLISNCKDQTIKLWDVRKMVEPSAAERAARERPTPAWNWDYRYMRFPAEGWDLRGPDDVSVQTYRGHVVDQTLIRAYFSPRETTGQKYLYSGSSDGRVVFWDVVSGERLSSGEEDHRESGDGEFADASARVGSRAYPRAGPAAARARAEDQPSPRRRAAMDESVGRRRRGAVVRDCSWHPTRPTLVAAGWDGAVVRWDAGR